MFISVLELCNKKLIKALDSDQKSMLLLHWGELMVTRSFSCGGGPVCFVTIDMFTPFKLPPKPLFISQRKKLKSLKVTWSNATRIAWPCGISLQSQCFLAPGESCLSSKLAHNKEA